MFWDWPGARPLRTRLGSSRPPERREPPRTGRTTTWWPPHGKAPSAPPRACALGPRPARGEETELGAWSARGA